MGPLVSALIGLGGIIVGAVGAFYTSRYTSRAADRREYLARLQAARTEQANRLRPIALDVFHHVGVVRHDLIAVKEWHSVVHEITRIEAHVSKLQAEEGGDALVAAIQKCRSAANAYSMVAQIQMQMTAGPGSSTAGG